jgi:hypothetical protein
VKKLLWVLAAITLIAALCKAILPEWIVSGFHIGK